MGWPSISAGLQEQFDFGIGSTRGRGFFPLLAGLDAHGWRFA